MKFQCWLAFSEVSVHSEENGFKNATTHTIVTSRWKTGSILDWHDSFPSSCIWTDSLWDSAPTTLVNISYKWNLWQDQRCALLDRWLIDDRLTDRQIDFFNVPKGQSTLSHTFSLLNLDYFSPCYSIDEVLYFLINFLSIRRVVCKTSWPQLIFSIFLIPLTTPSEPCHWRTSCWFRSSKKKNNLPWAFKNFSNKNT